MLFISHIELKSNNNNNLLQRETIFSYIINHNIYGLPKN